MMSKILKFVTRHKIYFIPVLLAFLVFFGTILLSDQSVEQNHFLYSIF